MYASAAGISGNAASQSGTVNSGQSILVVGGCCEVNTVYKATDTSVVGDVTTTTAEDHNTNN